MARARGTVDLAIIGVMADAGLRRSEDTALTWSDIEFWADGTGRLTIQKGKNQIEPATVAVTAATARALRDIRPDDVDLAAPVFGLTGEPWPTGCASRPGPPAWAMGSPDTAAAWAWPKT